MRIAKRRRIIISLIVVLIFFCITVLSYAVIADHMKFSNYHPVIDILKAVNDKDSGVVKESLKKLPSMIKTNVLYDGIRDYKGQAENIFTTQDVNSESELNSYYLFIEGSSYDQLTSNLPTSGFNEVKGYLVYNGKKMQDVKLRFRGDNPWHWYYTQKSWRVKTDKDELVDNSRKLNLVNSTEKSSMIEFLSYNLGQKMGVLSAKAEPVRVFLNNQFMGIAVLTEQTDEYFLRNNNKLPSELYSGDLVWTANLNDTNNRGQLSFVNLWSTEGISGWEKMANNNSIAEDDFSGIQNLISLIEDNSDKPFSHEIEKYIDIEKYINWRACMTVIASVHTDNTHNNRLYFDPSSGKYEPILWDTDAFSHNDAELTLKTSYSNLDRAILKNPIYLDQVYKLVWETMNETFTEQEMLNLVKGTRESIKSDIYSDIYKDYLGESGKNRSYTNAEFDADIDNLEGWIIKRYAYLEEKLSQVEVNLSNGVADAENQSNIMFDVIGYSGVNIKSIELNEFDKEKNINVYRDVNFNGVLDNDDIKIYCDVDGNSIIIDETVYPASGYNPDISDNYLWSYYLPHASFRYSYIIKGIDDLKVLDVDAKNSVTGQAVDVAMDDGFEPIDDNVLSTHPWDIEQQDEAENIVFEAGEYIIDEDLVINKFSTLTIKEGANLKLKQGVSIYVLGKLDIAGSKDNPVVIQPYEEGKTWGVFAIQGHHNKGYRSNIDYAVIRGGGQPKIFENAMYTGMLSAYNADIKMTNTSIISNRVGDDGFNAKQCDVQIDRCYFFDAFSDAVDLDYASGSITNSYFESNGNDAIDLMTTSVVLKNNYIYNSGDKGISVGEKSHPEISNNIITDCNIGIEIKDLSDPQIRNVVLYANDKSINVYHKNDKYEDGGRGDIFNSIIAGSVVSSVTLDKDSKLNISDSIFDTDIFATKDLDIINCKVMDVDKFDVTINDAGLIDPIELWWE